MAGPAFLIGDGVRRASRTRPYERHKADPFYRPLRIYALDPAGSQLEGKVALVEVPFEALEPGPRGAVFEVDNHDGWQDLDYARLNLDEPEVLIRDGVSPSPSDPRFHQQMVYSVCGLIYAIFRNALGRDLTWGFERPGEERTRLRLRPYAGHDRNAWYSPENGELCFGYYQADERVQGRNLPDGFVFTALSHDIVAHEITHAVLDGLRAHFTIPSHPDVLAFHEAFADLVAIFQRFSYQDVVLAAIRKSRGELGQARLLTGLARQFGHTTGLGGPLRTAIEAEGESLTVYDPMLEPHALGSVLANAVFDAFNTIFERKVARYVRLATGGSGVIPEGELPADLQAVLAEEASKLARQFLSICIRAIDYCPPVDLRFGEFLRAVLTADHDLVTEDPWAYREAWIDAFARRRIYPPAVASLSEDALLWRPPAMDLPPIEKLAFDELRFKGDPAHPAGPDELYRQAEVLGQFVAGPDHLAAFGLARPSETIEPPCIQSIRTSRRVGPNGQVVFDLVTEVTQRRRVKGPEGQFDLYGGATLILGPEGEFRYAIYTRVEREWRLEDQRDFMMGSGRDYWRSEQGQWVPKKQLFRLLDAG